MKKIALEDNLPNILNKLVNECVTILHYIFNIPNLRGFGNPYGWSLPIKLLHNRLVRHCSNV